MKASSTTLAVALTTLALSAQATTLLSKVERWVGNPKSGGGGQGLTPDDPIDASTFETLFYTTGSPAYRVQDNVTLHLLPLASGTYTVSSPVTLPDGLRLIGSNATNTVIRLTSASNSGTDYFVLGSASPADNSSIYISDLTLDGNWGGSGISAKSISGLGIAAGSGTVERVRVINCGANANATSYSILWKVPSTGNGQAAIQDCIIPGPIFSASAATSIDYGIAIAGGSNGAVQSTNGLVIVRNNHLLNLGAATGVGVLGCNNVLIDGNTIAGLSRGVGVEQGNSTNIQVLNNIVVNVRCGISVGTPTASSTYGADGITIANNLIELEPNQTILDGNMLPIGIRIRGGTQNTTVKNNLVQVMPAYRSSYDTLKFGFYIFSSNASVPNANLILTGNTISSEINNYFQDGQTISYSSGNHTLEGGSVDIPAPVVVMSSTSLNIDSIPTHHQWGENLWISMVAGTASTLHLPDPGKNIGRRYHIFLITPPSGSASSVALECSLNTYPGGSTTQEILDMKTGVAYGAGSPVTAVSWPASGNWQTAVVTLTSIASNWKMERP